MGLFDGRSYSEPDRPRSHSSHHTTHRSSHTHSPTRSQSSSHHITRPSQARSSSSFFGNSTSRGIFSSSHTGSGSSYYKRRPRDGYISMLLHRLQRMFKELWYYARRHPVKAFFAVVVPLLSAGGAIGGLMKSFGVRLPMGLGSGLFGSRRMGGGYYGSSGYDSRGFGGGGGWMENLGPLMQIGRAFM